MPDPINTHNLVVDFGKHKGTLWTRLPVSYLKWLANEKGKHAEIALAELKRRGTVTPEIEVSGHAIDRASQQCIGKWTELRLPNEGLHAWLCRMAKEARDRGRRKGEKYQHAGMLFVFNEGELYPVLMTVMTD
jgi:uncharacterized protein (DUF3820 family)